MNPTPIHPSRRSAAGHYRRFKGYDYSRGAAIFITFAVARRAKVFGAIDPSGRLVHSPAGLAALATLAIEERRSNGIVVEKVVIMPDHVHLRIYLRPGLERPLDSLARFIRNFKRWVKYNCSKLGAEFDWERGYHDRLCLSREIMELADKYIDNNPLKWHLMHGNPPPLKVAEPFSSPRIPGDEWWSAAGATELAAPENRICAIRLSRRIPAADHQAVVKRLMKAVDMGFTLAGTFISPMLSCSILNSIAFPSGRQAAVLKNVPRRDKQQQYDDDDSQPRRGQIL